MLFAADVAATGPDELARTFWSELSDDEVDEQALLKRPYGHG